MSNLLEQASLVVTPNGVKEGKLYSIKPSDGSGDLSATRATTATRVNSSGLIESVATNVPRLDYTNGTCPSILVEPQRTNISAYVESGTGGFNSANIASATNILGLKAFKVTIDIGAYGDSCYINTNSEYQANTAYTISYYTDFSKCTGSEVGVSFLGFFPGVAYAGITVNKTTKAITTFNIGAVWTINSSSATQISEQIYKITCTATPSLLSLGGSRNYITTDNLQSLEISGIQLEAGSYATSYIQKTTNGSITRNADVISKTGISSLIGQTEGTLFCEVLTTSIEPTIFHTFISVYGNLNNRVVIGKSPDTSNIFFYTEANGVSTYQTIETPLGRYKIALGYKNGNSCLYINGVSVFTSSNTLSFSTALTDFYINERPTGLEIGKFNLYNSALWKTRLTNSELAQLTTL